MCYGRKDVSFPRQLAPVGSDAFVAVLKRHDNDSLYLDAGLVHVVCEGDEFAVYPLASREDDMDSPLQPSFHARLRYPQATRSVLESRPTPFSTLTKKRQDGRQTHSLCRIKRSSSVLRLQTTTASHGY